MPISSSVLMTRIAISPRFATSTLVNIGREGYSTAVRTTASAVQPALDLVGARPAAVAAACGGGAVGAPDRGIALVVQLVVGDVVAGDVVPHVGLAPVRERVGLPQAVLLVPVQLGGVRAAGRLLAPQPRDPCVDLRE